MYPQALTDVVTLTFKMVLCHNVYAGKTFHKDMMAVVSLTDGDLFLRDNSVRVFVKRRQCKGELDVGKQYLIMGKDGTTTDSNGA